MKKLLLIIAFAILGLGLNAQNVGDETTIDYGDYSLNFRITNVELNYCEVVSYDDAKNTIDVIIPSTVEIEGAEYSVTSIGDRSFSSCYNLTSIEIPSSVTSIGDYTFASCYNLTSIEIPSSVTSIGEYAFGSCENLKTVTIGDNSQLTSIGKGVFSSCWNLTSIEIPSSVTSIGEYAFYNCSNLTSIEIPSSVTSIGEYAFDSCSNLTSIEIPSSVTSIGEYAFGYCENLKTVTFGDNSQLTSIGNGTFSSCRNLTSVEIPSSITSIGDYAFASCYNLTSIEIPGSVTYIGNEPFSRCDALSVIKCYAEDVPETGYDVFYGISPDLMILVPAIALEEYKSSYPWNEYNLFEMPEDGEPYIGNFIEIDYDGYSLIYITTSVSPSECMVKCSKRPTTPTSITIPSTVEIEGVEYSVTSFGNRIFYYCDNLTSIEIPSSFTSIGDEAFYECENLKTVTFGDNSQLTSIGDEAFYGCSNLKNVTFGDNSQLTSIGDEAFRDCSSLTSIEIPGSVTYIGNEPFSRCDALSVIKCYAEDVPETGYDVFYGISPDLMILVPATAFEEYQASSPWNEYNLIAMPEDGEAYIGNLIEIDYDNYSLIYITTSVSPSECMVKCTKRPTTPTAITIPSTVEIEGVEYSVTSIGDRSFSSCYILTSIEIPSSVTSIGESAFSDCNNLTSIEIPSSVTSIGESAFRYCEKLKTVTFVDNSQLTSIENRAFYDCSSLTSIEIPSSVTSIGGEVFVGCSSLTSIVVEEGNSVYDSRENCNAIIETESNTLMYACQNTIIPNTIISIGYGAFYGCYENLTSIEIPSSVTSIGDYAFYHCSKLTSIEIPSSVTSIGDEAFYGCSNLKNVTFGDNSQLTSIGDEAFRDCSSLTSIEIPGSVTYIGNEPFSRCDALSVIKCYAEDVPETGYGIFDNASPDLMILVPATAFEEYKSSYPWSEYNLFAMPENGEPYIGNFIEIDYDGYSLFYITTSASPAECKVKCTKNPTTPTSITIPSTVEIEGAEYSVTSIGDYAFASCYNLTSIEIPSSVTSIGEYAFGSCENLKTVTIGDNSQLTSIGDYAFAGCYNLTGIEIPGSVTSIGEYAFDSCSNLTSIEIPSSVTSIGDRAFAYCENLKTVTFGDNSQLTSIGNGTFSSCRNLTSIEIPGSVTSIGEYAFDSCSNLTSIEIPSSVTSIGDEAFSYCSNLKTVTFGDNSQLTSIGNEAFYHCSSLTSIEIPSSVTYIGDRAFAYCSFWVIKCYAEDVPETGDDVFYGISSDMMILVPATAFEEYKSSSPWNEYNLIAMPEDGEPYIGNFIEIDYDGYSLFYITTSVSPAECMVKCSKNPTTPTSITIPSIVAIEGAEYSVTSIGDRAFYQCYENLISIEIPSSVTSIGSRAFVDCYNLTSIEIPSSVASIGDRAFASCSFLSVIKCYAEDVPETGDDIFDEVTPDLMILVPAVALEEYQASSPWNEYNLIAMPEDDGPYIGNFIEIDYDDYSLFYITTSVSPSECMVKCSRRPTTPTAITIPSTVEIEGVEYSVTSIGSLAFYDCWGIVTSIEIPSSVTSIGYGAFAECSLINIEIPGSVTSIGDYAFADCEVLTSVRFGDNSQLTSIGDYAFVECESLTSVRFGDNSQLTSIGNGAFADCPLINIEIPSSVTSIGDEAFAYCGVLTIIKCYAEDVPETGDDVFYGISSDMMILVPATAFEEYKSSSPWNEYNLIAMPEDGEPYIGNYVEIDYDDYSLIYITTSVSPSECMVKCTKRPTIPTAITIPSSVEIEGAEYSVTSIGYGAFYQCYENLISIEIPSSVTSIGYGAFYYCENLTSVTFGDNSQLTSIENRAFGNCDNLTSIEIPGSVTSIGDEAFASCNVLTVIKCYAEDVPETGDGIFEYISSDLMILVPATAFEEYKSSSPWNEYNLIAMPEDGEPYIGNLIEINYDDYSLIYITTSVSPAECMVKCSKKPTIPTTITIPSTVEIEGVEYSVTTIGDRAFYQCYENLISIEIPSSVTSIGEYAFAYCHDLEVIKCYAEDVPDASEYCFGEYYDYNDLIIYVPKVSLEDYISTYPWSEFTILSLDDFVPTPKNLEAKVLSSSTILLSWDAVENATSYNVYQYEDVIANVAAQKEMTYLVENLKEETEYWFRVTTLINDKESNKSTIVYATTKKDDGNDDGNDNPTDTIVPTPEVIEAPENLITTAESISSISLGWDEVENAESYNIYRDGDSIANVTNTTYTDKDLEYDTEYCYSVTAVKDTLESAKSEEVCIKTLGENIEELSSAINIYPNPVENDLFITTEMNVKEVAIYDVYGRHTMSQQVNETTSQQVVDVTDLEAGVYFVKVATNEGEIVKRFIKK